MVKCKTGTFHESDPSSRGPSHHTMHVVIGRSLCFLYATRAAFLGPLVL